MRFNSNLVKSTHLNKVCTVFSQKLISKVKTISCSILDTLHVLAQANNINDLLFQQQKTRNEEMKRKNSFGCFFYSWLFSKRMGG